MGKLLYGARDSPEDIQHSHLKLKSSCKLKSTLSGEGYVLILYHKMRRPHLLNFSLPFFFPCCDCWIQTLAHVSPSLLMNLEHGRGRQFLHQWQGQEVEDQLMGNMTKWYPVQLCWFLSLAMGTKRTWSASDLCWLFTSNSIDRLFWYLFGAWLMLCSIYYWMSHLALMWTEL